jgi:hypothetical protein
MAKWTSKCWGQTGDPTHAWTDADSEKWPAIIEPLLQRLNEVCQSNDFAK